MDLEDDECRQPEAVLAAKLPRAEEPVSSASGYYQVSQLRNLRTSLLQRRQDGERHVLVRQGAEAPSPGGLHEDAAALKLLFAPSP